VNIKSNAGRTFDRTDSFNKYRILFTLLIPTGIALTIITVYIGLISGKFHYPGALSLLESVKDGYISIIIVFGSITFFATIILFIIYINSKINNVIVFPFESMDSSIDGNAIADILIMRIHKINDIHNKPLDISPSERLPLAQQSGHTDSIPGIGSLYEESASITKGLEGLGNLDTGLISLSVGRLLISLYRFRPIGNRGCIIHGSIQKYKDDIYIISHIRTKDYSFIREINGQQLHEMVNDLAFMIVHKIIRCEKIEDCSKKKIILVE
jgi:hypothetical protein